MTAPLFIYLVFGGVVELYKWFWLSIFVSAASRDLLGEIVGFFTMPVAVLVLLLSPALWYSLLKNTPQALARVSHYRLAPNDLGEPEVARWKLTLGWVSIFIGFQIATYGLNRGAFALGAWMVDRKQALSMQGDWLLIEPPLKKISSATFEVDAKTPQQRWTVERTFESLDACQRRILADRDKPPTDSDLGYFPVEQRRSLTAAVLAASHQARCVSRSSPGPSAG